MSHIRSYCNESSCNNAISRNEKRKDEAAEDLWTFIHMRNGAQADKSARREAQKEAVRARRDQSAVGLVVVARRKLRLRRRRRLLLRVRAAGSSEEPEWCSDDREEKKVYNFHVYVRLHCTTGVFLTCYSDFAHKTNRVFTLVTLH